MSLDVAVDTTGRFLGKTSIDMNPFNNNTDSYIWPITPFFPNAGAQSVKAAISVMNNLNNKTQTRLFVRYGNDRRGPSTTWTGINGWKNEPTGNSDRNFGTWPMGVNKFWAQLGLGVKTTSASNESRATIHVACSSVGS